MWLIVWISLLLSVIRLSGIPFEYVLPLVAGWIVYQWLTLRVGWRLAQWLGPKWTAWRHRFVPRETTGKVAAICVFHVEHHKTPSSTFSLSPRSRFT